MFYLLIGLTLILTAADHWTTWVCLRSPVEGWTVTEANPIADWLFTTFGLVPGLLVDSVVTLWAVGFLMTTSRFPHPLKVAFFSLVVIWTGHAVVNNYHAIQALGLWPLA